MIEIREIKLPLGGDLKAAAAKKLREQRNEYFHQKAIDAAIERRREREYRDGE